MWQWTLARSHRDPTLWGMNLALSAPDGSFPIAVIGSPGAFASSLAQHVGLGCGRGVVSACVVLFQAHCGGGLQRVLCSLLGGIVPLRCAYLRYWLVCQDSHSFTLRDLLVPTVAVPPTPWLSARCFQKRSASLYVCFIAGKSIFIFWHVSRHIASNAPYRTTRICSHPPKWSPDNLKITAAVWDFNQSEVKLHKSKGVCKLRDAELSCYCASTNLKLCLINGFPTGCNKVGKEEKSACFPNNLS